MTILEIESKDDNTETELEAIVGVNSKKRKFGNKKIEKPERVPPIGK